MSDTDFDETYFRSRSGYRKFDDEDAARQALARWYEGTARLLERRVGLSARLSGPALEVGCGHGAMIETLARRGHRIIGCDLSAFIARSVRRSPGRPSVVVGDATELPVRSGSLAAVLALAVIEHLEDPSALLAEAHRTLRAGGLLIATTPNPDADMVPIYDSTADPTHISVKRVDEWERLLDDHGFAVVEMLTISTIPVIWRWGRWSSWTFHVPRFGADTLLIAERPAP